MPVHSDSPTFTDLLNRRSFAEQISSSIAGGFSNDHDSIVFGLNGIWGSGKSTLLNFLKEELEKEFKEKDINFITYHFNPWMFSGQENLQREFLEGLLEELSERFKGLKEKQEWVENAIQYFKFAKLIPYVKETYDEIEKMAKSPLMDSIRGLKEKVDGLLIQKNIRLLVFIDDLDRLAPSEVIEMFQLVKLNSNFKNTFFFLAYDKEVVESALEMRFGENSKRYLEKIVQVDYKVPEILPEIRMEIFFKKLKEFFEEKEIPYDDEVLKKIWRLNGFGHYFRSLRDVYRYLNALYFRLPSIWKDVNITDFLLLEAIRIFDYDGYERLYRMEANNHASFGRLFEVSGKEERLSEEEFTPVTMKIVRLLLLREKDLNSYDLDNEKSFSNPQYLSRYFALQLSGFDVSVWEFEDFLIGSHRSKILTKFYQTGRILSFFDHFANLNSFEGKFKFSKPELFRVVLDFLNNDEILRQINQKAYSAFGQILTSSKNYFKSAEFFFNELFKDSGGLSFSKFLFIYWTLDELKNTQTKNKHEELFFKKHIELLESMKTKYLEDWHTYIFSDNAIRDNSYSLPLLISCFAEYNPKGYQDKMIEFLKKEKAIIFLCKILTMPSDEDSTPRRFRIDDFNQYCPPPLNGLFTQRLKDIFPTLEEGVDKNRVGFVLSSLLPEEFPKGKIQFNFLTTL